MKFSTFRIKHDAIRAEAGLLEKERLVAELLGECKGIEEQVAVCHLLMAVPGEKNEGLSVGIKEQTVATWLGLKGRRSLDEMRSHVAKEHRASIDSSVLEMYGALRGHAFNEGRSEENKVGVWRELLAGCKSADEAFLATEILCGKLPNKVDDILIVYALTRLNHEPQVMPGGKWDMEVKAKVRSAFNIVPNVAHWVTELQGDLNPALARATTKPGRPTSPQLADPVKELPEIFDTMSQPVVESKLDGMRIHAHISAGRVWLFTRELKNVTDEFPEVVEPLQRLKVKDAILDGELVALGDGNDVLPFKELAKRFGAKGEKRKDGSVGIVFYDVLHLDGASLLDLKLSVRRKALESTMRGAHNSLTTMGQVSVKDAQHLRDLLEEAHSNGQEGLMVKDLESTSYPGERNPVWAKLKGDYMKEAVFGDSIDLVVIGYNRGRGRRNGLMGALWLGVRNEETKSIESFCKVGTGFTDADLAQWTPRLKAIERQSPAKNVTAANIDPDAWVEPELVVEVRAAEITHSPTYAAGAKSGQGLSLRFPRYLRSRPDKGAKSSTSLQEALKLVRVVG